MLAQEILNSLVKGRTDISSVEYDQLYDVIDYTINYMVDKYKLYL